MMTYTVCPTCIGILAIKNIGGLVTPIVEPQFNNSHKVTYVTSSKQVAFSLHPRNLSANAYTVTPKTLSILTSMVVHCAHHQPPWELRFALVEL